MTPLSLRLAASTARARRAPPAHGGRMQTRNAHTPRPLKYPIKNGLGNFLPPTALKMIAEDYQRGLLDRLNEQVQGTALSAKSVVQTVVEAAREPGNVLAFNYASEALNNSYFLDCLKPLPADASSHEDDLAKSPGLHQAIRTQMGSLEQLKSSFSAAVLGMFSSGWMWFVSDEHGRLAIYPTFGTGTLLIRSKRKMVENLDSVAGEILASPLQPSKPVDHDPWAGSAPASPASGLNPPPPRTRPPRQSRTFSSTSMPGYQPRPVDSLYSYDSLPSSIPGGDVLGDVLYPLFCVSVHEHAWVGAGYGVWGKEEYMKRFWTVLDWEHVGQAYNRCRSIDARP